MIKSIKAINFLPWKKLEFTFDPGVVLLTGWNKQDGTSEAIGKSSILNALTFCLYGKLPKDVNIDQVIHTGEKSCSVEVELDNGNSIVRTRSPNKLYIKKTDGSIESGKDVRDCQKLIDQVIGMSFETFCQTVYYPQNYQNKFITANEEQKAKILSEIQDLSIFDRAAKKSNDSLKELKTDHLKYVNSKLHNEAMLKVYKEQLDTFCKLSDTFDVDKLNKLDVILERSLVIGDQIDIINREMVALGKVESVQDKKDHLDNLNQFLINCNQKLYSIEQINIQKKQAILNNNCPTCGQDLPDTKCDDLIVPDNAQLLIERNSLVEEIKQVNIEYTQLLHKQVKNKDLIQSLNALMEQRLNMGRSVSEIELMNNPYLGKIEEFDKKITDTNVILDKVNNNLTDIKEKLYNLEFLKDGFKDIKSYVFAGLLDQLNAQTNTYLTRLFDVPVHLTFSNVSEEGEATKIRTTVILDGLERTLGLLSGGQLRRVQLAVDFALSDIVSKRSINPINLRILDEQFKDLSDASLERLVQVLKDMKGTVILIEHNPIIKSIVDKVYNIEFDNGVSKFI